MTQTTFHCKYCARKFATEPECATHMNDAHGLRERKSETTTEIPAKEQILLNALSKIGEKTHSMGCVYTMDGLAAAELANKAIEEWARYGR